MIYIFTFLGEFGVELLNWQGVIRKFAQTISPTDKIVCCSRANLYPLYETAAAYIDISEVELFQQNRACGYWCFPTQSSVPNPIKLWAFERRLKAQIKSFVLNQLRRTNKISANDSYRFIFSCDKLKINGCQFGSSKRSVRFALSKVYWKLKSAFPAVDEQIVWLRWVLFKTIKSLETHNARRDGDIYDLLDLSNNIFKKIEADLTVLPTVQEQLGWLEKPFVLCQARQRDIPQVSEDILPKEKLGQLIEALAGEVNVVLLSFNSGRWLDSYSSFKDYSGCFHYHCSSFPEQACLIHFAKHCLFFTEGDLGSHTYVPPFMGKDVTLVAPRSIYQLESAPIDFWNQKVFRFGGQMIPIASEEAFSSKDSLHALVDEIIERSLT